MGFAATEYSSICMIAIPLAPVVVYRYVQVERVKGVEITKLREETRAACQKGAACRSLIAYVICSLAFNSLCVSIRHEHGNSSNASLTVGAIFVSTVKVLQYGNKLNWKISPMSEPDFFGVWLGGGLI